MEYQNGILQNTSLRLYQDQVLLAWRKYIMRFAGLQAFALIFSLLGTSAHAELETAFRLGRDTPPGNIAISPEGRVFLSLHGFFQPEGKLVEVEKDGTVVPYLSGNNVGSSDGSVVLNGVRGLEVDGNGVLWMLDRKTASQASRLIGWDTNKEQLHRIIYLAAPIVPDNVFLNDLAVDLAHQVIYIADTAGSENSAIIVVDLETGRARRVLEGSPYTVAEKIDMVVEGTPVLLGGKPAHVGINPIALDSAGDWLYFGPMSGSSLYRVRTNDLRNEKLTARELVQKVEFFGSRPISDGAAIDDGGNVYITDVTNNAIGVVRPDGTYARLFQSDDLSWPNGFSHGPDGKIYVVVNQLHRSPALNAGKDRSVGTFKVMRFDPIAGDTTD